MTEEAGVKKSGTQITGLVLGPAVFIALLLAPEPAGLEPAAWHVAAVAALLAIFWLTVPFRSPQPLCCR